MSNAILPSYPGLKWDNVTTPEFATLVQRAASGRELRAALMQFPLWTFKLSYEVLRDSATLLELQALIGFFNARLGSYDSFLYSNPDDKSVTDQTFGTGDGVTTQFQLIRSYGGNGFSLTEPVQNVNVLTNIKKNAVTLASPTDYSISSTGLVTFVTAPAAGATLTWTGTFYYRVRFVNDKLDARHLMQGHWDANSVEFVGAPGNRV